MRTGLRTEIILSISLLLAAALLFAGFLLIKLTEHNLLEQQRAHAARAIQLVAAGVDNPAESTAANGEPGISLASLNRLQTVLVKQPDVIAWRLLDTKLQILASTSYGTFDKFTPVSPSVMEPGELYEEIVYESYRLFFHSESQSYIDLSTALWDGNDGYGLLQIRFSLETLHQRVQQAQRLTLIYVVIYGLVLALFAVYLLNRNVVKPIRQLQEATTTVAAGNLTPVVVPSGPGEIHELADSFNRMLAALSASRTETEEHITSLEEINQALARARDDLVRSEKLATVGHLAAGMAHEIGNPLGAVVGYLNILKDDLSGDARELVERSLSETGRIDRLIRELLEYSAPADQPAESFCPISLLRETVEMLRHQGQFEGVDINDKCVIDGCLVSMDRGRLMQVWINLLLNAQDAMQSQGCIEVTSRTEGETISLSIIDSGPGITPEVAKRIFEPFYTTKAPGSGYGLGLAVCQRIITENGGSIVLVPDAARGVCFRVTLPCTPQENS